MQQFFNQLLQFLQQGISAIFRFVQMIWGWSVDQVSRLLESPWQAWQLWNQILLVLVVAAAMWAVCKAAKELWDAGERILTAFAMLLEQIPFARLHCHAGISRSEVSGTQGPAVATGDWGSGYRVSGYRPRQA